MNVEKVDLQWETTSTKPALVNNVYESVKVQVN